MSTTVWPPITAAELQKEEEASLARELAWLLESLQDTLASLKSGLEECYALLAPIEPGSTLVISSVRSEAIKGHVTRVGTRIVKGSLHLRLKTLPPIHLVLNPEVPIILTPLVTLRNLLNQALDCVDITRWTGDRKSATFISAQLRLLQSIISEARQTLLGPPLLLAPQTLAHPPPNDDNWTTEPLDPTTFNPPLPRDLSFYLTVQEASLMLTLRALEPADVPPNIGSRFAMAIGVQRRLEHDEVDSEFMYMGKLVRIKEKVRVESADPSLMAAMAKLAALEHTVGMARKCLSIVMEEEEMDDS